MVRQEAVQTCCDISSVGENGDIRCLSRYLEQKSWGYFPAEGEHITLQSFQRSKLSTKRPFDALREVVGW